MSGIGSSNLPIMHISRHVRPHPRTSLHSDNSQVRNGKIFGEMGGRGGGGVGWRETDRQRDGGVRAKHVCMLITSPGTLFLPVGEGVAKACLQVDHVVFNFLPLSVRHSSSLFCK